jgi:hypothetical protein
MPQFTAEIQDEVTLGTFLRGLSGRMFDVSMDEEMVLCVIVLIADKTKASDGRATVADS